MKNITRSKLRGSPLDEDCKKAKICTNECGENDNRCFCYGLIDCRNDEYLDKCRDCNAWIYNEEPYIETKEE